ncbi:bifunctional DNA primase/polymerase [Streptomyces sp. NPDC007875]|uniref:bifunctional DNA primase/polymerase n=1 Tax=Streptomyces sp. NPDC007875 TaxID=3364783 RepID=UPI0036C5F624
MNVWHNALENALAAAERGYAVFPLSRNKVPAIASPHERGHCCKGQCGQPGHGVHDATTVAADVRLLFDQAPRAAGYGVACGGTLRLIGLDLDRHGASDGVAELNRLATEHGFTIPRTLTVCTPSNGFHLWLTAPEGVTVPNSAGRVGPGIDVRGTGGYLVGPGSVGTTGEYVLHPKLGEVDVQPVPEALLRLMLPAPVAPVRRRTAPLLRTRDAALDGLVRVVIGAQEGERNSKLYWASCKVWAHVADGHMDAATAERALVDAAVSRGLAERDASRTVASARRTAGAAS